MELWQVAAALISAALHAGWNATVKASAHPTEMMTAQMVAGTVVAIPCLFWTGLPDPASWIWIGAATTINIMCVMAQLRAYELVGFGNAYPIMRAISVLFVVLLAAVVLGEALSSFGVAGVVLIALSLLMLTAGRRAHGAYDRRAFGWIVFGGIGAAISVMCDAQGVRSAGSPWSYGFALCITNAAVMFWRTQGLAARPWRLVARHARVALPIAVASMISFLLFLWVISMAPVAPSSALRDTSAIFAIIIAIVWLKEPITRLRLLAIVVASAAVPLLRFA